MADILYLRPVAFVQAPFGLDGRVARLAGGLAWFSAVELIGPSGRHLVPVEGIEARLAGLGEAARAAGALQNLFALIADDHVAEAVAGDRQIFNITRQDVADRAFNMRAA